MEIRFTPSFEHIADDTKNEIVDLIEKWGPFFTRQTDRLFIELSDLKVTAQISVMPRYRQARLTVSAEWLALDPVEREEVLVHELSHLILAPIQITVGPMMGELEPQARRITEEWFEEALESVTEDLSRAVILALNSIVADVEVEVCCESCGEDTEPCCDTCPRTEQ